MAKDRRCWDSDPILAWLLQENGKWQECQGVLQKAERGELDIVVSALAIAEVLALRGHARIARDRSATVRGFFQRSFIKVRQLDRSTAELAQEVVWDHGIAPKDAIHLATAIKWHVPRLDTFDEALISKSGSVGNPAVIIGRPDVPFEMQLGDDVA